MQAARAAPHLGFERAFSATFIEHSRMDSKAQELLDEARQILRGGYFRERNIVTIQQTQALQSAVEKLTEALLMAPTLVEAWVERSLCHYFLENLDHARDDARQALALNPQDPKLYADLAAALPCSEQRAALEAGRKLAHPNSHLYFRLWQEVAMSYYSDRNYQRSADVYTDIYEAHKRSGRPNLSLARHGLSLALWACERYEEMEVVCRESLTEKAEFMAASFLIESLFGQRRYRDVLTETDEYAKLLGSEALSSRVIAQIFLDQIPEEPDDILGELRQRGDVFASGLLNWKLGRSLAAINDLRAFTNNVDDDTGSRWRITRARDALRDLDSQIEVAHCSFCLRSVEELYVVIRGPGVALCDGCLDKAVQAAVQERHRRDRLSPHTSLEARLQDLIRPGRQKGRILVEIDPSDD